MSSTEIIRNPGDLEELIRALVAETIEGEEELDTHALRGALVLRPGETIDPSFVIKMPDGRQFVVIVREIGIPDGPPT
ncbi:MAG: hypothetical protein KY456_04135 [Chloroflexi bacterium]|nr:hypothetical protein [Chloroflexota bacterium]